MTEPSGRRLGRPAALLALALCLPGCVSLAPAGAPVGPLQPFTTDGCSLFPDRSPFSSADWCHCCEAHDWAYWRGGTAQERQVADEALRACVEQASGSATLAALMHIGVRIGGTPALDTSFRWAYGWPSGRGYRPLSLSEEQAAAELRAGYLAIHPALVCTRPAGEGGLSESRPE